MKIAELQELLDTGMFHHATYREHGSLWEGLFIYRKEPENKFNGFTLVGSFPKDDPDQEKAYSMVRNSGVSYGRYGGG
jgi:hypothetical protein